MKKILSLTLILTALFCASVVQAADLKFVSTGDFIDRDNVSHPWSIDEYHTLVWEGSSYIPVGGVFYSRYVSEGATDANWQEDVKALETLKGKGITDLLLKNIGPASWVKAEAWQKLIDHLDANGFTYGLDLSDNPQGILQGHVIRPHRYRLGDVTGESVHNFDIPDADSAVYVLADADGSVIRSGVAKATGGKLAINVKAAAGKSSVLLLYPKVDISRRGEGGIPNLWDGYDAYRDKLLGFLGKLKFGKGFRFFVDPFDVRMSITGDLSSAVPDSPAFRLEYESWLQRRYPTPSNAASAWGLVAQDVPTMQEAARVLPLWYGGRGVAHAYDPATNTLKTATVQNSAIWDDIIEFRDTSIRYHMNAVADVLKTQVANVPVIFRMGDYYKVYANTQPKGGYDGLAVDVFGRGEELIADRFGSAYSLASESAKTMWTIASGVSDIHPTSKTTPGFGSKTALTADLSLLQEGGAKGIYVTPLQMSPKSVGKNSELLGVPEQLDWLAEFKKTISGSANFIPTVVYYPSSVVSGAHAKRLGKGIWWLPGLQAARTFSLGDEILGYSFNNDNVSYIWSLTGPMTATMRLQKDQSPLIVYPDPPGERAVIDKDKLVLKLDGTPIGVRGLGQTQIFPSELAQAQITMLEKLIPIAEKAGNKVTVPKASLGEAKKVLKNGSIMVAYEMARNAALNLHGTLAPFAWLEGESTIGQNFDEITGGAGASFGRYLLLNSEYDAPMTPYGATYSLSVPKEGNYDLWLAGYVPGDNGSPMAYSVDGSIWVDVPEVKGEGNPYGPGFKWSRLGKINLKPGQHTLAFKITGRRKSDNHYAMAIDVLLLTVEPFTPSGIKKPEKQ